VGASQASRKKPLNRKKTKNNTLKIQERKERVIKEERSKERKKERKREREVRSKELSDFASSDLETI